ncbi:M28 family peptidase [Adhaeribacter radiodurans]|uniref:M28 family peptidase n=1 Tax=Adhaeribacter radiodurans TaxID=2745197 RepID=A0A7L7L651_9BACT|nr:M28 family peptidase [Adhaeribacter radiodurans]QMU28234.1 M28 family peptidase [Adhaeribacter radiodurans]
MKVSGFIIFYFCIILTGTGLAQTFKPNKNVEQALQTIDPKNIEAHIRYLADDRLLGRLPGTSGYQIAMDYVVNQFKTAGVEPAGENGSFLQQVRLRKAFTNKGARFALSDANGKEEALRNGEDFILYPHFENAQVTLQAPLAFVGYGISAPELNYNDYAGLDVKGKVVVIRRGAPRSFPSSVAASSMSLNTILNTALKHGAIGVIISSPSNYLRELNGVNSVRFPDGKIAASGSYVSDKIKLLSLFNRKCFNQLLQNSGLDTSQTYTSLSAGKTASADLPNQIKVSYQNTYQDLDSYNIIGKITGSDAKLKNEYVLHTAHLDHMGISTPVKGDSIYNGAHDNASGVACLLEISKMYTQLKVKPKRSILIALVTGEEMGLLGSSYLAIKPIVPSKNLIANINTDMPTLIAPLLSVVALGAEHSSLYNPVKEAATYLNLAVEADPEPEQNRFVRSDQYSFVRQGIPALHIKYGNKTADGANNLNKIVQQWRETYYHKPQDDINGTFDFNAGKVYTQLNFLISYQVAQNSTRPTWNPDRYFSKNAAVSK